MQNGVKLLCPRPHLSLPSISPPHWRAGALAGLRQVAGLYATSSCSSNVREMKGASSTAQVAASMPNAAQSTPSSPSKLLQYLQTGEFWTRDFRSDVIWVLKDEFSAELPRLKRARADRKGIPSERPNCFGMLLYGKEDGDKAMTYYEIDRTLTSIQALRWIHDNARESFNNSISQESWDWIRARFEENEAKVFDPQYAEECYALITSVMINDLGKDPELAEDYRKIRPGEDIHLLNHDMQIDRAIEAGMVPVISNLRQDLRQDILTGIHVSAECNLGQLAQAENVAASLYPLTRLREHKRAWRFRFMELILDLAGARGHFDNTTATIFGESVARGNHDAHDVAQAIIWDEVSPRDGFNMILQKRYDYVHAMGYSKVLDIRNDCDRAAMRLLCLGGVNTPEKAVIYEQAFHEATQTSQSRDRLIDALNNDGLTKPAIQMTYLPAMCSGALSHPWTGNEEKVHALVTVLQYIVKVHHASPTELAEWARQGISVTERDVFNVVQDRVKSRKFRESPATLMEAAVPETAVANRKEPGYEAAYDY